MKNFYRTLYKTSLLIQFIVLFFSALYAIIWFYRAFQLPYSVPKMAIFEILPIIFRYIFKFTIPFAGYQIDMSYILAIVFLFILYSVFLNAGYFFESEAIRYEEEELRTKEFEEKFLNAQLEQTFKDNTLSYKSLLVVVELCYQYIIDPNVSKQDIKFSALYDENYNQMIAELKPKCAFEGKLLNGRIIYTLEDFSAFESFMFEILEEVKKIYQHNKAYSIETSFVLCVDAIRDVACCARQLNALEKIASFKYTNKIIATNLFVSRYKYEEPTQFEPRSIGVSRFFGAKTVDVEGKPYYQSEDFDLYIMKLKRKAFFK